MNLKVKTKHRPDGRFDLFIDEVYCGHYDQVTVTPLANALTMVMERVSKALVLSGVIEIPSTPLTETMVKLPTTADEASTMVLIGIQWLEQNAPERLRRVRTVDPKWHTFDVRHKPPYDNCRFQYCDLPGQCRGEGKCHHPKP